MESSVSRRPSTATARAAILVLVGVAIVGVLAVRSQLMASRIEPSMSNHNAPDPSDESASLSALERDILDAGAALPEGWALYETGTAYTAGQNQPQPPAPSVIREDEISSYLEKLSEQARTLSADESNTVSGPFYIYGPGADFDPTVAMAEGTPYITVILYPSSKVGDADALTASVSPEAHLRVLESNEISAVIQAPASVEQEVFQHFVDSIMSS